MLRIESFMYGVCGKNQPRLRHFSGIRFAKNLQSDCQASVGKEVSGDISK